MRIEVVRQEVNHMLEGIGWGHVSIARHAAMLVVAALDSFDEATVDAAFRRGVDAGVRQERMRQGMEVALRKVLNRRDACC